MNKDSLNENISKAVYAFRSLPNLGDTHVYDTLVTNGMEVQLAARLVEFLPMAYCRLILAPKGVRFPDTFRRRLPDGGVSADRLLSSEPLWKAVVAFADAEAKRGVSAKDLLALATRSAEFDAANELLNKGSKLQDLVFTPVVLTWPEQGPPRT